MCLLLGSVTGLSVAQETKGSPAKKAADAFTAHPQNMQFIYSDLHQNIQDSFNEGGIEINSPRYASIRDGNRIAVPDQYIARDYQEPGFHISENKNSAIPGK